MKVAVTAVIIIGIFLRLCWLEGYPHGFTSREAKLAYRGKLLSQSLTDETGRKLPLFFTSFDGYQLPFSSYLVAASVKTFGASEFSARLPFALLGSLALLAFYQLIRFTSLKNRPGEFWATTSFALSPGIIFLTRTVSEWSLLFNVLLLVIYSIVKLFKIGRKKLGFWLVVIITIVFVFISLNYFLLPGSMDKLKNDNLGFFSDGSIQNAINQSRGEDNQAGAPLLGKVFFNKSFYSVVLLSSLFENINPRLYFAAGDGNPLHGLTNFGVFPVVLLPIFLIGSIKFFQKHFQTKQKLLVIAIFIFLLFPSVIDKNSPNQEKLVFTFPFFALVIGYGASLLSRRVLSLTFLLLVVNLLVISYDAAFREPIRVQQSWQYGTKELSSYLKSAATNYDKVYLTDRYAPDIGSQLVFYWSKADYLGPFGSKLWIQRVDNVQIGNLREWRVSEKEKVLFVLTPEEHHFLERFATIKEKNSKVLKICFKDKGTLSGMDGKAIFILAENIPEKCAFNFHEK